MERVTPDPENWDRLYREGYFETADAISLAADLTGVHYVTARRELSHAQNRDSKRRQADHAPGDREARSLAPTVYQGLQVWGIDGVPWQEVARDDPPWFSPWPRCFYRFDAPLMDQMNK